ncbi:hypothetical protein BDK51DRAFT_25649, partial [Blyttiomyces helicus]
MPHFHHLSIRNRAHLAPPPPSPTTPLPNTDELPSSSNDAGAGPITESGVQSISRPVPVPSAATPGEASPRTVPVAITIAAVIIALAVLAGIWRYWEMRKTRNAPLVNGVDSSASVNDSSIGSTFSDWSQKLKKKARPQ